MGELATPIFLIDEYRTVDVKVLRSFKKLELNIRPGLLQAGTVLIDDREVVVNEAQTVCKSVFNNGHQLDSIVVIGKESVFFWERESNVR